MTQSFYSDIILFAEDLTCYFLNKHLWRNSPFGSKIVAPTAGLHRKLLHNVFNSHVKAAVNVLHACLLPKVKKTFADLVASGEVNISIFMTLAILLRKDYFSNGVDAGNFLHYCVILANLSVYFYDWGCKDAPEQAVDFISTVFPDYESFHPFCDFLNKACWDLLQKERTLLASLSQYANFSCGFHYGYDIDIKCSCFEYEETGKTFEIVFKDRALALKKHALLCGVKSSSCKPAKLRSFDDGDMNASSFFSWNLKSDRMLRRATDLSKRPKDDVIPFKVPSYNEDICQEGQKSFAFPSRPFLNRNKRSTSSRNILSETNQPRANVKQNILLDANEENILANDCSGWKQQAEIHDILCIKDLYQIESTESSYNSRSESSDLKSDTDQNELKKLVPGQELYKQIMESLKHQQSIDEFNSNPSERNDWKFDADLNELKKPIAGQKRNKQMMESLNDQKMSIKDYSLVSQTVVKSSELSFLSPFSKNILENVNYIYRTLYEEPAKKVRFIAKLENTKTVRNRKTDHRINKLGLLSVEICNFQRDSYYSSFQSDSYHLDGRSQLLKEWLSENCKDAGILATDTNSECVTTMISRLLQYYRSLVM